MIKKREVERNAQESVRVCAYTYEGHKRTDTCVRL